MESFESGAFFSASFLVVAFSEEAFCFAAAEAESSSQP